MRGGERSGIPINWEPGILSIRLRNIHHITSMSTDFLVFCQVLFRLRMRVFVRGIRIELGNSRLGTTYDQNGPPGALATSATICRI